MSVSGIIMVGGIMDKLGLVRVSECCNATVREKPDNSGIPKLREYICNTCEKVCQTVFRKSSNAG
jgi:hypothetical protein